METKCLVVVSGSEQTEQDQRLMSLAAYMGVSTRPVLIRDGETVGQRLLEAVKPHPCSLAMSARTLIMLQKALSTSTDVQLFLKGACVELLVFDCSGSTEEDKAISWLTHGQVSGVSRTEGPEITVSFPDEARPLSRQLAGLNYVRHSSAPISLFVFRDVIPTQKVIVAANDRPMFVRIEAGTLQVFLLAGASLPNLDARLSREHELKEHYDRLLPVLMFLKHCFGESCWHSPKPTARVIIDDPLLTERYGFLDYSVLLKSMQRNKYGTSIAFIPWNCWRTSSRDAGRVRGNSLLSLCIHGCDHTNKEFEAQDSTLLSKKATLALQRMESMRKRTGAEFEPVMVFPQGRFSRAAITALRSSQYLAVVNSTCFPRNSGPDDLTVRDFLRPAITRYHGFPIFQRRYPRRLFDFACDLFLGKPALVVEHHEYFRNGVALLEDLIDALYRIEPDLSWPTLSSQLAATCLLRRLAKGSTEVQFFTRSFQLTPHDGGTGHYLLSKHEPDSNRIETALIDGKPAHVAFEGKFLKLEMRAEPGQVQEIEIVDRRDRDEQVRGLGIPHNARVVVRRALSEFRDNTLSRHSGLRSAAQWMASRMKVTGE